MSKWCLLIAALFLVCGCGVPGQKGFSIEKITSHHPRDERWSVAMPPPDVCDDLFNQPYYYLGSGCQTYSFRSQDGQYVIKFFKQRPMRLSWRHRLLSPFFFEASRPLGVREMLYSSCLLAFRELTDEAKLIALHLTRDAIPTRQLALCDQNGKWHTLQLSEMEFAVQRYGLPCGEQLSELIAQGRRNEAMALRQKILALVEKLQEKRIIDTDMVFEKNYGLVDGEPFLIDIGSLERGPYRNQVREMERRIAAFLDTE
jgi:hypothetical protein